MVPVRAFEGRSQADDSVVVSDEAFGGAVALRGGVVGTEDALGVPFLDPCGEGCGGGGAGDCDGTLLPGGEEIEGEDRERVEGAGGEDDGGWPVGVEQAQQGGDDGAEIVAAPGGAIEQALGGGGDAEQPVLAAQAPRPALGSGELGDVAGGLDALVLVEAARVGGDDVGAVEDGRRRAAAISGAGWKPSSCPPSVPFVWTASAGGTSNAGSTPTARPRPAGRMRRFRFCGRSWAPPSPPA